MRTNSSRVRSFGVLAAFATLMTAQVAHADTWPPAGKPVQIIVPAPAGGGTGDTIARLLAEQLGKRLGATFIIDNRGGANGNIGATAAARSAADGQTLLFSWAGTLAVNPSLYRNLSFEPQTSFSPIALVADVPNIIVVNNQLASKSLPELVRQAKAEPERLNFGSSGIGSSMHLAGELFMRETGTRLSHVPYAAPGQATTNLIANDIQLMFQLVPGVVGQVKGGKLRALAIMSPSRSAALPDVPTTAELGFPKLQSSTWFAMLAPKGTPTAILDRMNAEINQVLRDEEVRKKFTELGAAPLGGTRAALADHLAAESSKWSRVVKEAGIKVE